MKSKTTGRTGNNTLKELAPYLKESRWWLLGGLTAMLLIAALTVTFGQAIQYIIENVPENGAEATAYFDTVLLIVSGVILVYLVSSYSRMFCMRMVCIIITQSLRRDIFANIVKLGPEYIDKHSSGTLQTRIIADTAALGETFSKELPTLVKSTMMLIAALSACYYVNTTLAITVTIAIPIIVLPFVTLSGKLRSLGAKLQGAIAESGRFAGEAFRHIKVIQAFSRQNNEKSQFDERVNTTKKLAIRAGKLQLGVNALVESISFWCFAILFWIASGDIVAGKMTVGELVSFGFYVQAVVIAAKNLVTVSTAVNIAIGYAEKVVAYLTEKSQRYVAKNPKSFSEEFEGKIEFRNVHFSYPSNPQKPIFSGLNLTINANSRTAIIGRSGAGKSTLLELLLRIYDLQEGEILIDGVDIKELDRDELCGKIGFIPQQNFLVSGTVADNIKYGNPEADEKTFFLAAQDAHVDEFVKDLPAKYNTDIGEVGGRLSGGQQQRISLARAFVKEPKILLLDEATSALDVNSEQLIENALDRASVKGATMLTVTHSMEMAQKADQIVVLSDGALLAQGSHEILISSCPEYQRLCQIEESESLDPITLQKECFA